MILKTSVKSKTAVTQNVFTPDESSQLALLRNHHWKLHRGEKEQIFPFKLESNENQATAVPVMYIVCV